MPSPRVYFDLCALKRAWDDQSQLRVRLEADAVDALLQLTRLGRITFVRSTIHEIENGTNRDRNRRAAVEELLNAHPLPPGHEDSVQHRAGWLKRMGWGDTDAAHLAAAEALRADVLVTTDDRFIRRARRAASIVRVVGPIEYVVELL